MWIDSKPGEGSSVYVTIPAARRGERGARRGRDGDQRPERAGLTGEGVGRGVARRRPPTGRLPRHTALTKDGKRLYVSIIGGSMLQVIDTQWKDHLLGMDYLKEGIGLRGYGQRDPLVEYKKESFEMYQAMMDRIEEETIRYLYFLQPAVEESMPVRRERPVTYGERPQQASAPRVKQARSVIPKKRKKKKKR